MIHYGYVGVDPDDGCVPTDTDAHSPLVGRAEELDSLCREIGLVGVSQGEQPPGAAVLLSGDAGLGKTRLLGELRQLADEAEWRVVVGHCLDFGDTALPYLPFTELFGSIARDEPSLADRLITDQPALARLMPGHRMLHEPASEHLGRADLFDAVYAGLAQLSVDAPLLVILEDIHWADQSTRDLLTGLFTRPPAGPIAIVASYRSDDLHRRHPLRAATAEWARLPRVSRISLQPLPDSEIRHLVHQLHPDPISDLEVRRIIGRAEGNAFFTEELVAAVGEGGRMLPTDLADLLLVRLDRLDESTREIVRAAAVAGRRVSHTLLASVVGDDAGFEAGLRAAVDANILLPIRDRYAFRHALLAEAVYDDLLPGERVRWHTAYVAALSARGARATAAELARHARAAGNFRSPCGRASRPATRPCRSAARTKPSRITKQRSNCSPWSRRTTATTLRSTGSGWRSRPPRRPWPRVGCTGPRPWSAASSPPFRRSAITSNGPDCSRPPPRPPC